MFNLNHNTMRKFFVLMLLCATMAGLVSCQKEETGIKINQRAYTLYSDDVGTIDAIGLPDDAIWSSENEWVATAEGKNISSGKVGTTTLSFDGHSISATIKPRYSLYTEPDMSWGCSANSIISKYGQPFSKTDEVLLYESNNPAAPYTMYMFDETGLSSCATLVKFSYGEKLVDFLGERYVFFSVDTEDYTADFAHCYGTKQDPQIDIVGQMAFSSSIGGILVMYIPNTSNRTRSIEMVDYIDIMKKMLNDY